MQGAFWYVVLVVVAVSAIVAVIALAGSGRVWDQVGRGPMSLDDGTEPAGAESGRDEEVLQLLEARNARRRARGQEPLDVQAELRRLSAPSVDPGLRAEVRALVLARNERRVRRGEVPLDVDAEVERQLRDLQGM